MTEGDSANLDRLLAAISKTASSTDQSDNWAALRLTGGSSVAALERLCPIDVHPPAFQPGAMARHGHASSRSHHPVRGQGSVFADFRQFFGKVLFACDRHCGSKRDLRFETPAISDQNGGICADECWPVRLESRAHRIA